MQEGMRLRDIGDIRRCGHYRVGDTRIRIDPNMRLHPEMPLVSLLGLVRLRIALTLAVLGRGRRCNQGCIHHRTLTQDQALGRQQGIDRGKDTLGELVLIQQAAKLQERRCIRRRFTRKIDPDKAADRLAVVNGILDPFVGKAKALLGDIYAKHTLNTHRWAPSTIALGVVRLNHCQQRRRRHDLLNLAQKPVTPCAFLLSRVLQVRKTRLHRNTPASFTRPHSRRITIPSIVYPVNKSVRP